MYRALFLTLLFSLSQLGMADSISVTVPGSDMQDNLTAMLPVEQKTFYETIVITGSEIAMVEGNDKIDATLTIDAKMPGGITGTAQGQMQGILHYDANTGSFYLNKFFVKITEADEAIKKDTLSIMKAVQLAVTNQLTKKPVFSIEDNAKKQKLGNAKISSFKVQGGDIIVKFEIPAP